MFTLWERIWPSPNLILWPNCAWIASWQEIIYHAIPHRLETWILANIYYFSLYTSVTTFTVWVNPGMRPHHADKIVNSKSMPCVRQVLLKIAMFSTRFRIDSKNQNPSIIKLFFFLLECDYWCNMVADIFWVLLICFSLFKKK